MPSEAFLADFIAGWVAGGASLLLGHPLDTIKVRLQALKGYDGALQCIMQILRQETVGGFYKGMLFPFMSTGFLHSLYFGGHGVTMKLLKGPRKSDEDTYGTFSHLLTASTIGASFQWVPACPIEIVKTKLQIQKESVGHLWSSFRHSGHLSTLYGNIGISGRVIFKGPWDCLRQTVRHEGIAGLYRGGLIMLIRDVVGFCFYLPVYENVKYALTPPPRSPTPEDVLSPWTSTNVDFDHIAEIFDPDYGFVSVFRSSETHRHRLAASLIAGAVAGVASWFSILPLDVIKSRLQADDIIRPKYKGIYHCASESFRNEGLGVFFRGWQVVFVRAVPVNALLLLCYDETLRFLNSQMRR